MYEFVLWMCLLSAPDCDAWNGPTHMSMTGYVQSKEDCESKWKESLMVPDPEGMKARHICRPFQEPL